jgi:hypothetical protein
MAFPAGTTFTSKENADDHATFRQARYRAEAERSDVATFRQSLGLTHLIDVHTHFMPQRMLVKV